MPALGTEPAGLVAPVPWKWETGQQCPGPGSRLLPVPSGPGLWAQSSVLAANPARSKRPSHLSREPSRHASLGPFVSPCPSWPPQDPPQLLGGAKCPGHPLPHRTHPPTRWPGCRERQASPGRRAPGPAWSPAGGRGPGEQDPDEGQHISWDGKPCLSKALAVLAGGLCYFWIPCALTFPGTPSPVPQRF